MFVNFVLSIHVGRRLVKALQVNVILFLFIILGQNEDKLNRYLLAMRRYAVHILHKPTQRHDYEEVAQVFASS